MGVGKKERWNYDLFLAYFRAMYKHWRSVWENQNSSDGAVFCFRILRNGSSKCTMQELLYIIEKTSRIKSLTYRTYHDWISLILVISNSLTLDIFCNLRQNFKMHHSWPIALTTCIPPLPLEPFFGWWLFFITSNTSPMCIILMKK